MSSRVKVVTDSGQESWPVARALEIHEKYQFLRCLLFIYSGDVMGQF